VLVSLALPSPETAIAIGSVVVAVALALRHRHLERLLAERNAGLMRSANDMILLLDERWRIVDANDRVLDCYGYSREEMLGRDAWDFPAGESPWSPEELRRRMEEEGGMVFESLHRRKDGSLFPVEISGRLVRYGRRRYCQAIARDITERKRVEAELERKNAELALAAEAAQEASDLKSQFLANMSHEIRTPIHGILGMTELLLSTALDAEQREYADAARRSGQALLAVINDILDLSKIEAGKLEIDSIVFDLRLAVEEVVALTAFTAAGKKSRTDLPGGASGAAAGARRSGAGAPGAHQPGRQRGEVHRARRGAHSRRDLPRGGRSRHGALRGFRYRHRYPARASRAAVPDVQPGRAGHHAPLRGHGARPGHLAPPGGADGWADRL
jgi:PAS domain S-box-containing protein